MTDSKKKALLIILDGMGIAEDTSVSAVDKAKKPFFDSLIKQFPHATLSASGEEVGLPEGQFGNSEVGHLNIGAGRVVYQELTRVNKSIRTEDFFSNDVLVEAFRKAEKKGKIHFMGLFSDGGVHSHNSHLFALLRMAKKYDLDNAYVHAFTDGRDTSPHGGENYYQEFKKQADSIGIGTLASVVGRYFAMDRDNRWERTQKAYDLLVHGKAPVEEDPIALFQKLYKEGSTDEFIPPHITNTDPKSRIQPGDVVIYYNIRGDRARQITKSLLSFDEVPINKIDLDLHYVSFTSYDETFGDHVHVAYPPVRLENTLGKFISDKGLKQVRIAETEKYPHVTYFFNGGEETPNPGEDRIMIPSPKVATYDLKPEMSADVVADKLCEQLSTEKYNLGVVNFANPDMVAHTGDMKATIKAIEFVDKQLEKVVTTAQQHSYDIIIISDHGNSDKMIQPDGSSHTAHTTALVPVILVTKSKISSIKNGILADVSPTLLKLLGIEQPSEMTGTSLY
ncbi:MAG: 2,3-bisphosphoglycerate-independent phosphoglycerate mutase [Balneolaceae bacterium]